MESDEIDSKDVEKNEQNVEESDESMDDNDDDDEKIMTEIKLLNEKIKSSPFNYQAHVERIKLFRKCGEYEQLLAARKEMADLFPLTQELWLNWLDDEQKFAESDEDHENVQNLFERAVQDYMCPEIWLEYAQYSIRYIGKEGGFDKIRQVLKRAITAAGLHVCKGVSIWEAYREIENAILDSIQPAPGSMTTPQQNELMNDQASRISSLFTRQLAIPLLDMERTFEEYLDWRKGLGEEEALPQQLKDSYDNALKALEKLKSFESDLDDSDIPNLDTYRKYIDHEKKSEDPARVQCLYERAVADNCLNSELWTEYISYLNKTLKSGPIVVSVCLRSVRNCPWTSSLWQSYLLALERNQTSYEKLESTYRDALQVGFSSAGDYAYLFQTWCDIVRRHYCNGSDKDELARLLRAAFENSTTYLLNNVFPAFKSTGDPDYTLWCYWARCEARYLKNMVKARQIIDVLMEDDAEARRNWKIWKDYYELERLHGDVEHCRAVLRRAVQSCAADDGAAEMACAHYVRFERENGSLEDLDDAMKKVEGRLAKVQKRKDKVAHQMQERKKKWDQNGPTSKKWKKDDRKPKQERSASKRPARREETMNADLPQKRTKPNPEAAGGFKAPLSLPPRFAKISPKLQEESKPVAAITPPPGFRKSQQPEDESKNSPEKTEKKLSKPPGYDERSPESDAKTVFLSNLGFEVQSIEDKLKEIFSKCGAIASIRLVKSNKGNFRGYAYVEFENKSSVDEALKLDREPLEGRPIFVSPNVDKSKHPDFKIFKYSKGMEKHKLFVSGLCFDTTEETLKKIFSEHGALKSVRIVTARSGKSKGLAYVEYEKETDATQAVIKTDQSIIDGFTIKVAISNPPARNRTSEERGKALGGGGRSQVVGGRGRGRTQVSFLPRSLQKNPAVVASAESKKDDRVGKPMSNKDFAKLLLKN